ncbi:hypothetical protein BMS3Abin01_00410 [bacterium BMS3Abin01]|nr:hypothetical protein BMS3Abin01_00410 [bacterium BMS3Abin01]HDZ59552.1 hypothetical protein [Actinomycetota bacterium]
MTTGRYGAELVLDQCPGCGGVWFDRYELFRVDEARARQIGDVDEDRFRHPAGTAEQPQCPVCHVGLEVFRDANIPGNIQLLSCPECNGFWANHGEAAAYAGYRAGRGHRSPDPASAAAYEQMLRNSSDRSLMKGMESFGHQLGGPRDFLTGLPLDGTPAESARIDQAQDFFFATLGVAARLLFWWL